MVNEKRLIDANELLRFLENEIDKHESSLNKWERDYVKAVRVAAKILRCFPTVDAVEVGEHIELREQYDKIFTEFHELRDAFVDYVCGGIPNPSPFCKNKYPGCCDSHGWCKNDDKCKGFNPAEIFMDGERKDNVQ